jgi:hypothetical protein
MGIQGLAKLIADHAPNAIKQSHIKNYFGRKIAIDASMSLYQFLIAIRTDELNQYTLMNELGEQTRFLRIFVLIFTRFSIILSHRIRFLLYYYYYSHVNVLFLLVIYKECFIEQFGCLITASNLFLCLMVDLQL